jgi:hypothetical protein
MRDLEPRRITAFSIAVIVLPPPRSAAVLKGVIGNTRRPGKREPEKDEDD